MSRDNDTGLFESLRRISATALSIAQSRLELALLELSVARHQLFVSAMIGFVGALLIVFGFVTLTGCLAVLLWDHIGLAGPFILGLVYIGIGVGLGMKVRNDLRSQSPLLEATTAELQRDATMLRGHPSTGASAGHGTSQPTA